MYGKYNGINRPGLHMEKNRYISNRAMPRMCVVVRLSSASFDLTGDLNADLQTYKRIIANDISRARNDNLVK